MAIDVSKAKKLCICKNCPSYFECGEKLAYCFLGKSKCIKQEVGCICPGCPVEKEINSTKEYYCTRGSNKELSGGVKK
ncbi:Uncharacterised protein [Candidatus Tiddalikarchaeum anstoanum]|nr:Uncharacterised protein [Candidatus Tiddalikarchaeum anstoanum]